jgi:hypothetical protein
VVGEYSAGGDPRSFRVGSGKGGDLLREGNGVIEFSIVAELEMAQGAVDSVLFMAVQGRALDQLNAKQRRAHQDDKQ